MLRVLFGLVMFGFGGIASAQSAPIKGYGYCYARLNGQELVTNVFPWPDARDINFNIGSYWRGYLRSEWGFRDGNLEDCSMATTEAQARQNHSTYVQRAKAQIVDYVPLPKVRSATKPARKPPVAGQSPGQASANDPAEAAAKAERARTAAREQREAEFQAKLAAHEAQVAEYQRKVKAREAEIARQQSEHAAAQEKARQVQAAHAQRLAEAQRAREEWLAVKRRHDRCMGGDQQACADMAAGKPASADKLADAGEASTDTDANRCVTTAETRTNASFKGNTSASVLNGCGQKVDVRICLKRTAGWNCATVWGVAPQARATHSSFDATGEVFVDAKVSNSKRALASPGS